MVELPVVIITLFPALTDGNGFTVIVSIVFTAQTPVEGVNVYVVVAVLSRTGDQVPDIPLFDKDGKTANGAPEQIGETDAKVGNTFGLTVIVKGAVVAH